MSQRLKILNSVGARPNLPKIAPLMRETQRHPEIEPILVHTGQHYDEKISDIFSTQMGIPSPHVNPEVGSGSHAAQTAEILKRIEPVLLERKPDLVLVVGDVNSTIAVSLAAVKLGIRVAHVEAGLPNLDRSMPEEINPILTDAPADYLFVTEEDAIEHLLKEGRPREAIHFVGNVMIDSLRHFLPIAQKSAVGLELGLKDGPIWRRFAVLTLHRPSNVDSTETLAELLGAIDAIAKEIPVIFPVHPRTQSASRRPESQTIQIFASSPPSDTLIFSAFSARPPSYLPIPEASRRRLPRSGCRALPSVKTQSAPLRFPKAQTCSLERTLPESSRQRRTFSPERERLAASRRFGTAMPRNVLSRFSCGLYPAGKEP
jgi:UDP-N-acetylglucosamine 2-epimerase